ncbi:MarR family transcriptional regulator [Catellatospora sp. NPDC049609]|uniref:MarR family winged helix-turn-helix transcriptional regulator n=1 Tax=Catellatospora sp. NPDC049609 TaxID=3155505 RepID=UPI0034132D1A
MSEGGRPDAIADIDQALIRLRRLLEPPAVVDDPAGPVETSTILVVNAVADGPLTVTAVAAALSVTHSTASRLISRAVAHGAVRKQAAADDRRETLIEITAAGAALHQRARAFRHAMLERLLAAFTPEQRAQFATLLSMFADATRKQPPPPED